MTTHLRTLIFLLGLMGGIVVGEKFLHGTDVIVFSLATLLTEGVVYYMSKKKGFSSVLALVLMLFFFGVFVGGVRTQFITSGISFVCEKACEVTGIVERVEGTKDTYQSFDLKINEETLLVRVRAPLYPEYAVGDKVELLGKIVLPENFVPHSNKKSFDYVSYLSLNGIGSQAYYPKISVLTLDELSLQHELQLFHKKLVSSVLLYVSEPASYLASGMLLGVSNFSSSLLETFRVTGLSHIVVLSGYNITILILFVLFLLRLLPVGLRVLSAVVVVVIFVIMVGGGSSLIRASAMAFVSLAALFLGRGYVATQALLVSLIAILLYSPLSLFYDVSLHLSFLATSGIVYGHQSLSEVFSKWLPKSGAELLSATIAAYLTTLPYVLYTFGTFSVYGVIANLLVLPFVPITMSLTAITITLSFLYPALATVFGVLVGASGDSIIFLAHTLSLLPVSSFSIQISYQVMALMYSVIIIFFVFLKTHTKNETTETKEGEILSSIIRF